MTDTQHREAGPARALLAVIPVLGRAGLALLGVTLVLSVVGGAAQPALVWLVKAVIDQAAGTSVDPRWSLGALAFLIAGVGAVIALEPPISSYVERALNRRITRRVHDRLFTAVGRHRGLVLLENPSFHDRLQLAYAAGVTAPSSVVASLLSLVSGVVSVAGFLVSLVAIAPVLAVVAAVAALPGLAGEVLLSRRYGRAIRAAAPHERRQEFFAELLTSLRTAKEIRLFGLTSFFRGRMLSELDDTQRYERWVDRLTLGIGSGVGLLSAVVSGGAVIYAVHLVATGQVTVGSLAVLIAAFSAVQLGFSNMFDQLGSLHRTLLMMRHYQYVVSHPPDIPAPAPGSTAPVPRLRHGIEFRDVWFRYDESHRWALRSLTVTLPAGCATALVGLNGAGKSTMVNLLCRLYDPQRGAIYWDGVDLRELDVDELRSRISTVFQDFMIYDLTVAENIALGELAARSQPERLVAAARKTGLHDTLAGLPRGYDTLLSRTFTEGPEDHTADRRAGVLPSGGQRQRLAIARALLRERAELLILDEPSAALDPQTEYELHELLRAERAGRTSLLVSHRLSTVRGADQIVVLADGRVQEQGTHDQLMASGGEYARLFWMQAKAYQLPDGGLRQLAEQVPVQLPQR